MHWPSLSSISICFGSCRAWSLTPIPVTSVSLYFKHYILHWSICWSSHGIFFVPFLTSISKFLKISHTFLNLPQIFLNFACFILDLLSVSLIQIGCCNIIVNWPQQSPWHGLVLVHGEHDSRRLFQIIGYPYVSVLYFAMVDSELLLKFSCTFLEPLFKILILFLNHFQNFLNLSWNFPTIVWVAHLFESVALKCF